MKKRLRKKKGLGEFTDFGVWILIRFSEDLPDERWDDVSEGFLDYLDEHGMRGSISGPPISKALVFMNWKRSVITTWMADFLKEWLEKTEEVVSYEFSDEVDARRGDWPAHWPEGNRDEVSNLLAHWGAWDAFRWHKKNSGNSMFDHFVEEGMDPFAYRIHTLRNGWVSPSPPPAD